MTIAPVDLESRDLPARRVGVSPALLVSVRSAAEAEIALQAGAALIDVKEPSRGPLGRADAATIAAVVRQVAGRRPVSAALGELPVHLGGASRSVRISDRAAPRSARVSDPADRLTEGLPGGLTFIKFGLAAWRRRDWRTAVEAVRRDGFGPGDAPQLVLAAYADAALADAPAVEEMVPFACRRPGNVLLIDTFAKPVGGVRRTLLDWIPAAQLGRICRQCQEAGVRIALAGSLGRHEIATLRAASPDWFAVRGAACRERWRSGPLCGERIAGLARLLRASRVEPTSRSANAG